MTDKLHKVFIQSNNKQMIGALVSKYTICKYSSNLEKFDVEIINAEENRTLNRIFGKEIIKDGSQVLYNKDDLQSFTLLRFSPPELMNYEGVSLVIDPDVFSVGADAWELLSSELNYSIKLRISNNINATSVMLLNNSLLKHWSLENIINDLILKKIDYRDQMSLKHEKEKITPLHEHWNSFDKLSNETKFLHNTNRLTQPWKTGLKVDFIRKKMKPFGIIPREFIHFILGKRKNYYQKHPIQAQEDFFFIHLKEAIEEGYISETLLTEAIQREYVRKDVFDILSKY